MAKQPTNPVIPAAEMLAIVDRATREGRHGPCRTQNVCSRCRQDKMIYHVEAGGGKGVCSDRFCFECYKAIHGGEGRRHSAETVMESTQAPPVPGLAKVIARIRAYRPSLEDVLLMWAEKNFRPAFEAYYRADDRQEQSILGRIVRERAAREPQWLLKAAQSPLSGELILLGPYIRTAGGYPLPGVHESFADWVREVRTCPI